MDTSALFYVFLTLFTVAIACFVQNQAYVPGYISGRIPYSYDNRQAKNLAAMIGVYGLLAGVSACRVAIGADYWVYRDNFELISLGRPVPYEIGFRYVVQLMQWIFGSGTYRTIFFLFSVVTVFFFLKALHDQAVWYAGSLYLLLTCGYYFSSMHSVRYYFALSIALYAAKYILRKDYLKFLLFILVAATFHKSVLVVIPACLAAWWISGKEWKKIHYAVESILLLFLIFGQGFYSGLVRKIIFTFYPYYEGSTFDVRNFSWANIAKCLGVLALCILCRQALKEDRKKRFYAFMNLEGLILYTCGSFIPEISRIGYYLIIFQVFLIPELLISMKPGWKRWICMVGTALAFALYFFMFLYKAYDDSVRLLPYREWIFH